MTERQALVALYSFTYFGPARTKLLIDYFGTSKKAWEASAKELVNVGLRQDKVSQFIEHRKNFEKTNYFAHLKKLGIDFITINDNNYPQNLVDLPNSPLVLYVKGKIERRDSNAVAIVGTRKMTSYGRQVAQDFAQKLAALGVTIISGLALGVDTEAHKSALTAGGRTIAVIGCGLDKIYPAQNSHLAKNIEDGRGAVISEYPLGYPALRENFASRNRIISGLSKAVVVVEGAKRSGTLLTASAAATQGRQIFAVPGQITSPMSAAPHFLIEQGAKIAFSANDVLGELNLQLKVDPETLNKVMPDSDEEQKLIEILENEPLHLDEIARISSLELSTISARLTIMELKGLVRNIGGGVYKKI